MNDEPARLSGVHRSSFPVPLSAFITVALLFLAARIALLFTRQPFFDELFTVWMARQPLADVVPNLLHDSGPPLYYWMARFDSVRALRGVSLFFAALQFALIAFCPEDVHRRGAENAEDSQSDSAPSARSLRLCGESTTGFLAASLLAVYPPAVLSAVDSRAYALCALFVTAGMLALAAERPFAAAAALILAAYSHYYGVLFFPLLLTGVGQKGGAALKSRLGSFAVASLAFIPGLMLAFRQPSQALGWNREPLLAPLLNLSWIGMYPESLFAGAPLLAAIGATLLLAVALARTWRFAPAVLVPLVLVLVLHIAGRPVYFPMRFESVIAGPLVLWVASGLTASRGKVAGIIATALMIVGAISVSMAIRSHARRPLDPYRNAALVLRDHASPGSSVVATGFCYLETAVALARPVAAWPAEQGTHPGWRAQVAGDVRDLPRQAFLWIGERQSPELARLKQARRLQPLFLNERAVIARVEGLTPPLH